MRRVWPRIKQARVPSPPAQFPPPLLFFLSLNLARSLALLQVVSNRMAKSVLVAVTRLATVPKYNLRVRRTKKFMV